MSARGLSKSEIQTFPVKDQGMGLEFRVYVLRVWSLGV